MEIKSVTGACSSSVKLLGIQFKKEGDRYIAAGSYKFSPVASFGGAEEKLSGKFEVSPNFKCKICGNRFLYQCCSCGAFVCYDGTENGGAVCPSCGNRAGVPAAKPPFIVRSGGAPKVDIVLAIDVSASMAEKFGGVSRLDQVKKAMIEGYVDKFGGVSKMGLISFGTTVEVNQPLTLDKERIKRAINALDFRGGTTSPLACVRNGGELDEFRRSTNEKYLVIFTDGAWAGDTDGHIHTAERLKKKGIRIIAIGCDGASESFLKKIASPDGAIVTSDGNIGSAIADSATSKVGQ